ncbi:MAG: hypothetical protein ACR2HF_00920 [Methylococcaceae bacterium]
MYAIKHICATGLLALLLSAGVSLAEESMPQETTDAVLTTSPTATKTTPPHAGLATDRHDEVQLLRVKSVQEDADLDYARGGQQTDHSDKILALSILLGLGGFAIFLNRNKPAPKQTEAAPETAVAEMPDETEAGVVVDEISSAQDEAQDETREPTTETIAEIQEQEREQEQECEYPVEMNVEPAQETAVTWVAQEEMAALPDTDEQKQPSGEIG